MGSRSLYLLLEARTIMSELNPTRSLTMGEVHATDWKCTNCGGRAVVRNTMDVTTMGESPRRYLVTELDCTAAVCKKRQVA